MAKIIITIEDKPNGKVKVDCNPSFEAMATLAKFGKLESAHGYAFTAIRAIREESRKQDPKGMIIKLPRISAN